MAAGEICIIEQIECFPKMSYIGEQKKTSYLLTNLLCGHWKPELIKNNP